MSDSVDNGRVTLNKGFSKLNQVSEEVWVFIFRHLLNTELGGAFQNLKHVHQVLLSEGFSHIHGQVSKSHYCLQLGVSILILLFQNLNKRRHKVKKVLGNSGFQGACKIGH